jgi:hypothetical protein
VRRWRFTYADEQDRRTHDELRARAGAMQRATAPSTSATEVAVRTIEAHAAGRDDRRPGR